MSIPPSRAQSEVFSTSQYGTQPTRTSRQINHFILPTFILSVVGLACLWALWYYMSFTSVFPYHHRVFYCRDIYLYLPSFRPEDFQVYVSYAALYALGFALPPTVRVAGLGAEMMFAIVYLMKGAQMIEILIGEIMFWLFSTKPRKTVYANCGECKVHLFTRRVVRFIAVFMFGALITQIFTHTIKLMTGYQRPYFLSLCNVNMSMCTAPLGHSPSPSPALACKYRNADDLRYAWLSLPSLHAAFSSYSSIFISCYIYYMINMRGAPLLRPLLIFGFLGLALVDSFSRINGYKNHWRYIWVGWLIGFFIAIFLCHSVMWFQDVYHIAVDKVPLLEQRVRPFFSWFRLPRVHAPSIKEEYVVYEEDMPEQTMPSSTTARRRRNLDRTYEVTTTESFHRTISPPATAERLYRILNWKCLKKCMLLPDKYFGR